MRLRAAGPSPVHLIKLAVGVPSVDAFEARVAARRGSGDGMQVWTRSFPRRAAEILAFRSGWPTPVSCLSSSGDEATSSTAVGL